MCVLQLPEVRRQAVRGNPLSPPPPHSSPLLTPLSQRQQHSLIAMRASAALLSCFLPSLPHTPLSHSLYVWSTSTPSGRSHTGNPSGCVNHTRPFSHIYKKQARKFLLQTVLTPSCRHEESQVSNQAQVQCECMTNRD